MYYRTNSYVTKGILNINMIPGLGGYPNLTLGCTIIEFRVNGWARCAGVETGIMGPGGTVDPRCMRGCANTAN